MCMKQHLEQERSILNRTDFSMREKQPEPSLELIETCHYLSETEYKGKNMTKMVLSSLAQGILMLYSNMYTHISRPIWYPGFSLERIKKKFLVIMCSHSLVSSPSWVSSVLCFYTILSSVTVPWYLNWWCYRSLDDHNPVLVVIFVSLVNQYITGIIVWKKPKHNSGSFLWHRCQCFTGIHKRISTVSNSEEDSL